MVLSMNRPMKRSGSSFEQFRKRVPANVLSVARGKKLTFSLPPATPGGEPLLASVTVGKIEVRFSLQTADPSLAKQRNAAATEQFEAMCKAFLNGPRRLDNKERQALAGIIYRAFANELERDPGEGSVWARAQLHYFQAVEGKMPGLVIADTPEEADRIERLALLERRYGGFVDAILLREGIVADNQSRELLLGDFGRAIADASAKLERNASGDYTPDPVAGRFPPWPLPEASPTAAPVARVPFDALLKKWETLRDNSKTTVRDYRATVKEFTAHLGHDDAQRVTKADVRAWRDKLLAQDLAKTTINGAKLAHIQALYRLGIREDLLKDDPTRGLRLDGAKKAGETMDRYTDAEVATILALADAETKSALHWLPWLLALTGARVGEIAQLWGKHVERRDGIDILNLTPTDDGGTIKTAGSERQVPIHPALIERGFLKFVATKKGGPLFYGRDGEPQRPKKRDAVRHASKGASNRVGTWIRGKGFNDPRKAPSHAFRHWFKSKCSALGIPDSVADAIQGHVGNGGEAGRYRHFDLLTLDKAIRQFPVPTVSSSTPSDGDEQ